MLRVLGYSNSSWNEARGYFYVFSLNPICSQLLRQNCISAEDVDRIWNYHSSRIFCCSVGLSVALARSCGIGERATDLVAGNNN